MGMSPTQFTPLAKPPDRVARYTARVLSELGKLPAGQALSRPELRSRLRMKHENIRAALERLVLDGRVVVGTPSLDSRQAIAARGRSPWVYALAR